MGAVSIQPSIFGGTPATPTSEFSPVNKSGELSKPMPIASATSTTPQNKLVAGMPQNKLKYKVVIVGSAGVGKTSLLTRFMYNDFNSTYQATIGIDFLSKTMNFPDKPPIRLQLWDTAGQDRFQSLISGYIRDCTVAIIVYDITSRQSFNSCQQWFKEVLDQRGQHGVIIALVANKVDLVHEREVSDEEGEKLREQWVSQYKSVAPNANGGADPVILFQKTSAKAGDNVENLFKNVADPIYKQYAQQMAQTVSNNESSKLNLQAQPKAQTRCCSYF